ncbi:beta-N-acetylhexosaminidase [Salinicola sp. MH3R3-1]|uniref:beta-N-acetylhexosaminidase n=1 Tax=Salinicola sp. MH3R3-1 TaxID=1928762 RepID=UPI00094ECEF4|nr:beta-N-acetylhexosaminidase [Salinicola sp. MH3R3-1]OLO08236.1 beta-N-acetylhexosaminidase [Salinicola sp. MH3R3-1]
MTQPLGPVMLDVEGTRLRDEERQLISRPEVGGVLLFARNTPDVATTQALIGQIRECRPDILVAVDQEGGRVQRLKDGVTQIPAMATLGRQFAESPEAALTLTQDTGWLLGMEMAACGFDLTFAPVLDLDDDQSPAIGSRSFSPDPEVVSALAGAFVDGLHESGLVAIGKHFPGHGGARQDSHFKIAEDPRPLAALREHDLIPFARLAGKLDGIMPAHVIYSAFDDRPAGFSPSWLGMLREELGFKGAIFSDDLTMAAAHAAGTPGERAEAAWNAGCDMAVICNAPADARAVVAACEGRQAQRIAKLRYARARPSLESLAAISRWRRTHARLNALNESE